MIWILAAAAIFLSGLVASAWWGSNIILHPPKMLKMEIWPDRYQLVYDPVEFRTSDGLTLKGWLIPAAQPTDKTILMCHGWGDNKGDLLQHTYFLAGEFNLFFVDFRQHGESEGTCSTVGYLESMDIDAALEFLNHSRPAWAANLGAFGLSMGAAIAVWAAAHHLEIKAVAIEAPFASFNEMVKQWTTSELRLPYFPFTWLTLIITRLRLKANPEPYSPIYHVDLIAPRPLFIITGALDRWMLLNLVRKVFDKAKEPKELWVIPDAPHGKCQEKAGPEYPRRLLEFFKKNL